MFADRVDECSDAESDEDEREGDAEQSAATVRACQHRPARRQRQIIVFYLPANRVLGNRLSHQKKQNGRILLKLQRCFMYPITISNVFSQEKDKLRTKK
jgi:hypothetical protein